LTVRGDEHLAGVGSCGDARADVHGDPGELVTDLLALAGVHAAANFEAELADALRDRACAHDRARWSVECGEETVAGVVDLAAAVQVKLTADARVMTLEQVGPAAVAESVRLLGRADQIGEEDRRQDALRRSLAARVPSKSPRLGLRNAIGLLVDPVVDALQRRQLDDARSLDALGEVLGRAALRGAREDDRRHAHRRQDVRDVGLHHHPEERQSRAGAQAAAHV